MIENDFAEGNVQGAARSAAFNISGRTSDTFRTIAGVRAARKFEFRKMLLIPEIHGNWTHEWLDNPHSLQARFIGVPGAAFNIIDRLLPDDGGEIGVGVTAYKNEMAFNFHYATEFGRSDFINHTFDFGLKVNF